MGMDWTSRHAEIKLRLPALGEPLPDYVLPYVKSDEVELTNLLAAMLHLIQDAEEALEWHRVAKRLESYRFDHLTFTQKFVRFNSKTKSRISDELYKSFREIGACERRLVALKKQFTRINTELLPTAKRNAELKRVHKEWPRPDNYIFPVIVFDCNICVNEERTRQHLGEGIWRMSRVDSPRLRLLPTLLVPDVNGFIQIHPNTKADDHVSVSFHDNISHGCANENQFHDNISHGCANENQLRLEAEMCRLKIARALKLRELSHSITNGIYHNESDHIRNEINALNESLIVAAQAYIESSINSMTPDEMWKECNRVEQLSDFEYAVEVFATAGVSSWKLMDSEEDSAIKELRCLEERRALTAEADNPQGRSSSFCAHSLHVAAHISDEEIEAAVKLGPDAVIAAIMRLQRIFEDRTKALNKVKLRYTELSIAQRYVRRTDSKTWMSIKDEKITISLELKALRSNILKLRESLKLLNSSHT